MRLPTKDLPPETYLIGPSGMPDVGRGRHRNGATRFFRTQRWTRLAVASATLIWSWMSVSSVGACPFCSAVSQTLRQEMETMDAVVIASAIESNVTRDPNTGEVMMRITKILKSDPIGEATPIGDRMTVGDEVKAVYYGDVEVGRRFLLSGVMASTMQWSCLPLNERTEQYVSKIPSLPVDDAAERLRFYMPYLQDPDAMLSRDAYDEFAVTPYEDVIRIRDQMDHDQLVEWIRDPEMSPERKRLYLTMLGVCGDASDIPLLESLLRSTQKSARSGLDALIACYLTLAGEDGLPLINELFLANDQSSYADTYAAIMAIRFHGTEGGVIARSALVESLHYILERPDLADLIIPDLARWQDWSQIQTVKRLFIDADPNNNWIRVPAVNYLRACPLPEAKTALEELTKVDPKAVKRANTFFAIPKPADPAPSTSSSMRVVPPARSIPEPGKRIASRQTTNSPRVANASLFSRQPHAIERSSNHTHPLLVVAMALATILVGQWILLTGGRPAEDPASQA
ncbi:MAG: hypothetical protein AAF670_10525 [Planctomycetota bacterium]